MLSWYLVKKNEGANVSFRCSFTYSVFFGNRRHEVTNIRNQWSTETEENHGHFLITWVDLECPEKETDISQVWDISPPSHKPLLQLHLLTAPSPCCIRYVQSMDKQCALSQAKMCAAEWSIWAYFVTQLKKKKNKQKVQALHTSAFRSATLSCSSRTFSLSSRLLRSSPSVTISSFWGQRNATSQTKPLKQAIAVLEICATYLQF